jgi:hypothetical protein
VTVSINVMRSDLRLAYHHRSSKVLAVLSLIRGLFQNGSEMQVRLDDWTINQIITQLTTVRCTMTMYSVGCADYLMIVTRAEAIAHLNWS